MSDFVMSDAPPPDDLLQEQSLQLLKTIRFLPHHTNQNTITEATMSTLERHFREFVCKDNNDLLHLFNYITSSDNDITMLNHSPFYQKFKESSISVNPSVCGHIFTKGEGVYRCRECGLDDTCVMCSKCFNATHHEDHEVYFYVSSAGGCCDCGDPEAWKIPLNCPDHSIQSLPDSTHFDGKLIPEEFRTRFRALFSLLLEYCLDIFSRAKFPDAPETVEMVHRTAQEAALVDDNEFPDPKDFFAILWNDEVHNFNEVIDIVMETLQCSNLRAKGIAENVDKHGRAILEGSQDVKELIRYAQHIANIKLQTSVCSRVSYIREEVAGGIIKWITRIFTVVKNDSFHSYLQNCLSNILCEELLKPWNDSVVNVLKRKELSEKFMSQKLKLELYLSCKHLPFGEEEMEILDEDHFPSSDSEDYDIFLSQYPRRLRIDWILHFDIALWKSLRIDLKNLFIKTIIADQHFKKIFGIRFAKFYHYLANQFMFKEREPDLSLDHLAVQLFTSPSIAAEVAKSTKLLSYLLNSLTCYFTSDGKQLLNLNAQVFVNRHYFTVLGTLAYILSFREAQIVLSHNQEFLQDYANFIALFEGACPNIRYVHLHVEYESDTWLYTFWLTHQLVRSIPLVAKCFNHSKPILESALKALFLILKKLHRDKFHSVQFSYSKIIETQNSSLPQDTFTDFEIPQFSVSSESTSFHNPVCWLISRVIESYVIFVQENNIAMDFAHNLRNILAEFDPDISFNDMIKTIMDRPLRVMVLLGQIRQRLWVRNGLGIKNQATYYNDVYIQEQTKDCDLFFIQVGACLLGPDKALVQFMDRFEIIRYFEANIKLPEHPWSESTQFLSQIEEFLQFLIVLITQRTRLLPETTEEQIRSELIHFLATSNLSYSEITKRVSDSLSDSPHFSTILEEVALFKPPDGISDRGMYELKESCFTKVNRFFYRYSTNDFSATEERITKWWEKLESKPTPVLSPPSIKPLPASHILKRFDSLFSSAMFVRVLYYCLGNISLFENSNSKDAVIDRVIYLILLALDFDSQSQENSSENTFTHNAIYCKFPIIQNGKREMFSLLELIAHLHESNNKKEFLSYKHELKFILEKWMSLSSECKKELETILDLNELFENRGIKKQRTTSEKKSEIVQRQQAMMESLAENQKSLLSQLEAMYGSEDEDDDLDIDTRMDIDATDDSNERKVYKFCTDPCIVCQKEMGTTSSTVHGLVGLIRPACLESNISLSAEFICENSDKLIGVSVNPNISKNDVPFKWRKDVSLIKSGGLHFISCGHQMHLSCFQEYFNSLCSRFREQPTRNQPVSISQQEFLCPMCKALCNVIIPIYWNSKKESPLIFRNRSSFNSWLEGALNGNVRKVKEMFSEINNTELSLRQNFWFSLFDPSRYYSSSFDRNVHFFQEFNKNDGNIYLTEETFQESLLAMRQSIKSLFKKLNEKSFVQLPIDDLQEVEAFNLVVQWSSRTITEMEILHREMKDQTLRSNDYNNATIISELSSQELLTLKTLGQTSLSFMAGLISRGKFDIYSHFTSTLKCLLPSKYFQCEEVPSSNISEKCLLNESAMVTLISIAPILAIFSDDDIHHLCKLLFIFHFFKSMVCALQTLFAKGVSQKLNGIYQTSEPQSWKASQFKKMVVWMFTTCPPLKSQLDVMDDFDSVDFDALLKIVHAITTPFLRQLVLYMYSFHSQFPVEANQTSQSLAEEYQQLVSMFQFQECEEEMFRQEFDMNTVEGGPYVSLFRHWCQNMINMETLGILPDSFCRNPLPFELFPLPSQMQKLIEWCVNTKCEQCKLVPANPALCLNCGQLLCCQSFCCSIGDQGECFLHSKFCSGGVGIFLLIKKSYILMMHNTNGCYLPAPYMDKHGEPDPGLRRGRPLFLNLRRYMELKRLWITGNVPSQIARKVEQTYDMGGWTSL